MIIPGNITLQLFVPLFVLLLFSLSCSDMPGRKPFAFGREKEILVICDETVWEKSENDLRKKLEVPVHAVRWEPIFEIAHLEAQNPGKYQGWDKIVLIESLEHMQLLPEVVGDSMLKKISEEKGLYFNQVDVWARNQRVAGLAAPTDDLLYPLIKVHGDRIFQGFLRQLEVREAELMYHSGKNVTLADSLLQNCGFSIVLPEVYEKIRADSLPENEMLFVQLDPVRSIFITWQENPPPLETSQPALAAYRDSRLTKLYPGMLTVPERVDTSTVSAGGIDRLRVYGVWENRVEISGGVYISQIIESPKQNRRYYMDCLLFCPDSKKNKYRYIFQLDHIMDSFALPENARPDKGTS